MRKIVKHISADNRKKPFDKPTNLKRFRESAATDRHRPTRQPEIRVAGEA